MDGREGIGGGGGWVSGRFCQQNERRQPNQYGKCRARHADVLEWLWFLNSHRKPISDWMWGDKDTYRLAFALAGKADSFQLVWFSSLIRLLHCKIFPSLNRCLFTIACHFC